MGFGIKPKENMKMYESNIGKYVEVHAGNNVCTGVLKAIEPCLVLSPYFEWNGKTQTYKLIDDPEFTEQIPLEVAGTMTPLSEEKLELIVNYNLWNHKGEKVRINQSGNNYFGVFKEFYKDRIKLNPFLGVKIDGSGYYEKTNKAMEIFMPIQVLEILTDEEYQSLLVSQKTPNQSEKK